MDEPKDQGRNGYYFMGDEVDQERTQVLQEDGVLLPVYRSVIPDDITRKIAEGALNDALLALSTLARVWPKGTPLGYVRDQHLLLDFAHLAFADRTVRRNRSTGADDSDTDDTDSREVLWKVIRMMTATTDAEHGCSSKEKRKHLDDIVSSLELILGVGYSPTADLATMQAVDLNKAGAEFAGIRPEDVVNETLRRVTFDFWVKKQTELAEQYRKPHEHLVMDETCHEAAADLVRTAIADGAFIRPFAEMPDGQKRFWLQRALGIYHT